MRIAKSRVVNLLITLGCPKAAKWSDEILAGRVATIHEVFDLEMNVGEKYRSLFEKVYKASKDNAVIEIIDDSQNPAEELLQNVDTNLRMKPVEKPTGDNPVKVAVSDSVVTIVPDVENDEADDMNDTDVPEPEDFNETVVSDASIEPKDVSTIKTSPVAKQSTNLPIYKSKFGRPQQVRRPLFTFEILDIPVGAKLYFTKDPTKCAVVHNKNRVIFEELFGSEPVSLSNLTKKLLNLASGIQIQPTGHWTYEGVTLKKLYYDKFPDNDDKPSKSSTAQSVSKTVQKPQHWTVFHWGMDINEMNPVECCLVTESLTIEDIAKVAKLTEPRVKQLLIPLVRYGVVVRNDDGTFSRCN
jgi:hypothetical protein